MTEREALKLALEEFLCREMPAGTIIGDPKWWVPKIAIAIKEALAQPEQDWIERERAVGYREGHQNALKQMAQPEPNYKKALEVWLDKTEWVQETVKPHELGMHRADVLKQRIEAVLAQPEQHQDWCASSTQMLMSMPPKPAPCNCKPKPEQEPVAYVKTVIEALYENSDPVSVEAAELLERITTSPPVAEPHKRKPLSDEQIYDMYNEPRSDAEMIAFARAIEAKHGIKG